MPGTHAATRVKRLADIKVVIGALVGMAVCTPTVMSFSYGLFMTEFEREFGWNRTQTSFSLTILASVVFLGSFPSGYLADRLGSRILASLSLASVGLGWVVRWCRRWSND